MNLPFWRRYNFFNMKKTWKDAVIAVLLWLHLFNIIPRADADNSLSHQVRYLHARLELSEANLRGCLTGGFTGVHYYTRDNKRVDIVCDKPAYEIRDN